MAYREDCLGRANRGAQWSTSEAVRWTMQRQQLSMYSDELRQRQHGRTARSAGGAQPAGARWGNSEAMCCTTPTALSGASMCRCTKSARPGRRWSSTLMLWDGDEKTHEHCHAMSAAASGPSAREYSMASKRASWLPTVRNSTVAMFTTCKWHAHIVSASHGSFSGRRGSLQCSVAPPRATGTHFF